MIIITPANFDELYSLRDRERFWSLVQTTISEVFNKPTDILEGYRNSLNEASIEERIIAFHNEPFALAADLTGVTDFTVEQFEAYSNLAKTKSFQSDVGVLSARSETMSGISDVELGVTENEEIDTLVKYEKLGESYLENDDYIQGEEVFRDLLKIKTRVYGRESKYVILAEFALANILELQNQVVEAQEIYETALKTSAKVFGVKSSETAKAHNNLAYNLNQQRKYVPALYHYKTALEINLHSLGDFHEYTALSYNNLGYHYHSKGDYDQAMSMFLKALEICEASVWTGEPISTWIIEQIRKLVLGNKSYTLANRKQIIFRSYDD